MTGYSDAGYEERSVYDLPNLESELSMIWTQVSPLYKQLYTYVRRRLVNYYGSRRIKPDSPIPAHIFGKLIIAPVMKSFLPFIVEIFVLIRKYVESILEKYYRFSVALRR